MWGRNTENYSSNSCWEGSTETEEEGAEKQRKRKQDEEERDKK